MKYINHSRGNVFSSDYCPDTYRLHERFDEFLADVGAGNACSFPLLKRYNYLDFTAAMLDGAFLAQCGITDREVVEAIYDIITGAR